jgi:hypothetical protein
MYDSFRACRFKFKPGPTNKLKWGRKKGRSVIGEGCATATAGIGRFLDCNSTD